jgi:hypothetical protein
MVATRRKRHAREYCSDALRSIARAMTISSFHDQHCVRAKTRVANGYAPILSDRCACTSVCRAVQNRTPTIADAHR